MITVETLGEVQRDSVWRCIQCTLAWIDGERCRLDGREWVALTAMPAGPFVRIDNPDFSDYRGGLFRYSPETGLSA